MEITRDNLLKVLSRVTMREPLMLRVGDYVYASGQWIEVNDVVRPRYVEGNAVIPFRQGVSVVPLNERIMVYPRPVWHGDVPAQPVYLLD